MSVIRPNLPPPGLAPQAASLDNGKAIAQRAFFAVAFGETQPAAQAAPRAVAPAPAAASRAPGELPSEPPAKLLRPGSILDIRI